MPDYFAMGGYAAFVWPAYGITFLLLGALAVASFVGLRARERDLRTLQQAVGDRRTAATQAAARMAGRTQTDDAHAMDAGTTTDRTMKEGANDP